MLRMYFMLNNLTSQGVLHYISSCLLTDTLLTCGRLLPARCRVVSELRIEIVLPCTQCSLAAREAAQQIAIGRYTVQSISLMIDLARPSVMSLDQ